MTTHYQALLPVIKTIVSGVTGIGNVYEWQRYNQTQQEHLDVFKNSAGILGWTITPGPMDNNRSAIRGQHTRELKFILRGWKQLEDTGTLATSSEYIFRNLIEDVIDALDANPKLNSTATGSEPAKLMTLDYVHFCNVLCHIAEIELLYRVNKQITYT